MSRLNASTSSFVDSLVLRRPRAGERPRAASFVSIDSTPATALSMSASGTPDSRKILPRYSL